MTTDNQVSPEEVSAALKRDGHYYTSQPLRFPASSESFDGIGRYYLDLDTQTWVDLDTQTWVCDWSESPSQDDFIRKGRGVLLALAGCAVIWVLVFWLIGGV